MPSHQYVAGRCRHPAAQNRRKQRRADLIVRQPGGDRRQVIARHPQLWLPGGILEDSRIITMGIRPVPPDPAGTPPSSPGLGRWPRGTPPEPLARPTDRYRRPSATPITTNAHLGERAGPLLLRRRMRDGGLMQAACMIADSAQQRPRHFQPVVHGGIESQRRRALPPGLSGLDPMIGRQMSGRQVLPLPGDMRR